MGRKELLDESEECDCPECKNAVNVSPSIGQPEPQSPLPQHKQQPVKEEELLPPQLLEHLVPVDHLDGESVPSAHAKRKEGPTRGSKQFNVMVAGASDLGKTSFFNTFTKQAKTKIQKTRTIASTSHVSDEMTFNLVDTPGYNVDNSNKILWTVQEEISKRQRQYTQSQRKDNRIHCLFYFIAPHQLHEFDVTFMRELASSVNVIPVLAKADSYTDPELFEFKKQVRERLSKEKISTYNFNRQDWPFSLISSAQEGDAPASRKYPWGVALCDNKDHCDLSLVRQLLTETSLSDLTRLTAAKHKASCQGSPCCIARSMQYFKSLNFTQREKMMMLCGLFALIFIIDMFILISLLGGFHSARSETGTPIGQDHVLLQRLKVLEQQLADQSLRSDSRTLIDHQRQTIAAFRHQCAKEKMLLGSVKQRLIEVQEHKKKFSNVDGLIKTIDDILGLPDIFHTRKVISAGAATIHDKLERDEHRNQIDRPWANDPSTSHAESSDRMRTPFYHHEHTQDQYEKPSQPTLSFAEQAEPSSDDDQFDWNQLKIRATWKEITHRLPSSFRCMFRLLRAAGRLAKMLIKLFGMLFIVSLVICLIKPIVKGVGYIFGGLVRARRRMIRLL